MPPAPLDLPTFVARWQAADQSERSSAQSHFIDLCRLLGQPTPLEADPTGDWYAFEKGVAKTGGGQGWADVWRRGHFAWEYKGRHKDLTAAYQQVLQYREALENPPLLVVCDLDRVEVHTNFTGTAARTYAFDLADLLANQPVAATHGLAPLAVLRLLFTDPDRLKPGQTTARATEQAAAEFAKLADRLRAGGADPEAAAHFLMRLLFCLFAEDSGLLPAKLFTTLVERTRRDPAAFNARIRQVFAAMATGGSYGNDDIAHFNGGLFADDAALDLTGDDLSLLAGAARLDWASIEPAILGTLFERSLEPSKRSQLGAHYTSTADILLIVEPVLMAPLRRRWAAVRAQAEALIARRDVAATTVTRNDRQRELRTLLLGFSDELAAVRVLDPACGSGNFLYVALKHLLDLEKEVSLFGAMNGLPAFFPQVGPHQVAGIETNVYAHQLASVVVWIGYLQWLDDNGFGVPGDPILKPLTTIQHRDAILAHDEQGRPVEPAWPAADVIIGNPPFLGGNRIRQQLGDAYVNDLFRLYDSRVPAFADLVCYWFEKARAQIEAGQARRAGLLATNSIRGGANRQVLERIKQTGDIFMAWSDRDWVLDGAAVRVSIVGFDNGTQTEHQLDSQAVASIYSDLTGGVDVARVLSLPENKLISFQGPSPKAPFDIPDALAQTMLQAPLNINGRPNGDVVRPAVGALELVRSHVDKWTIDFGWMSLEEASQYELPFEYVREHVYPVRMQGTRAKYAGNWWQYGRPRNEMRRALASLTRFIATPAHSKHRLFVWVEPRVLCNQATIVFAREDDYFIGVLHARPHELWSLRLGTALEDRPRYTPTTTFETYPFPWPPGQEPAGDARVEAIAAAARTLVEQRDRWLTPPDADAATLKQRTLTNLYNQRPTWLALAHAALDRAVFAAYGWPEGLSDEEVLARLLALNGARAKS